MTDAGLRLDLVGVSWQDVERIRGRIGTGSKYGMARLKDPEMLFKDAVPWYQQECQKSRRR
jgi:hypothetical protein